VTSLGRQNKWPCPRSSPVPSPIGEKPFNSVSLVDLRLPINFFFFHCCCLRVRQELSRRSDSPPLSRGLNKGKSLPSPAPCASPLSASFVISNHQNPGWNTLLAWSRWVPSWFAPGSLRSRVTFAADSTLPVSLSPLSVPLAFSFHF